MAKFTMVFLYVSGSILFGLCVVGLIASFSNPEFKAVSTIGGMIFSATIMGLGAILQVLREIAANTARNRM